MQKLGFYQAFDSERDAYIALLAELHSLTERTLSQLPHQSFSFRGGDTSVQAYRVVCAFLLRVEEKKKRINEEVLCVARMRTELARQYTSDSIKRLTDESPQLAKACESQKALLIRMDSFAEAARIFDKTVLRRFLLRVGEESDAEHDGIRCNISQIRTLCGAFCTQITQLCTQLQDQL